MLLFCSHFGSKLQVHFTDQSDSELKLTAMSAEETKRVMPMPSGPGWKLCQCLNEHPWKKDMEYHIDGQEWACCEYCTEQHRRGHVHFDCCGFVGCPSCGEVMCRKHAKIHFEATRCHTCGEPWQPILRIKPLYKAKPKAKKKILTCPVRDADPAQRVLNFDPPSSASAPTKKATKNKAKPSSASTPKAATPSSASTKKATTSSSASTTIKKATTDKMGTASTGAPWGAASARAKKATASSSTPIKKELTSPASTRTKKARTPSPSSPEPTPTPKKTRASSTDIDPIEEGGMRSTPTPRDLECAGFRVRYIAGIPWSESPSFLKRLKDADELRKALLVQMKMKEAIAKAHAYQLEGADLGSHGHSLRIYWKKVGKMCAPASAWMGHGEWCLGATMGHTARGSYMSPFPDANTKCGWDTLQSGGTVTFRSNEAIIRLFLCASRIKDCFEFSRPWLAIPDGSLHCNTMHPQSWLARPDGSWYGDDIPVVVKCTTTNVS